MQSLGSFWDHKGKTSLDHQRGQKVSWGSAEQEPTLSGQPGSGVTKQAPAELVPEGVLEPKLPQLSKL